MYGFIIKYVSAQLEVLCLCWFMSCLYIMCLLSSWKYYFSVLFSFYYTVVVGLGYKRYGPIGPKRHKNSYGYDLKGP